MTPKNLKQLAKIVQSEPEILAFGAKTSTVIPFESQLRLAENGLKCLVDVSCLEKDITLTKQEVEITGPVSWKELRQFLNAKCLDVGCWPTDQEALVLSGIATSATGERCFSRGALRDHIQSVEVMNGKGEIQVFGDQRIYQDEQSYHNLLKPFLEFKNSPFPRLSYERDLHIGMEGQLGIITSAKLKVFPKLETTFVLLPKESWKKVGVDIGLIEFARANKSKILSLEFVDAKSVEMTGDSILPKERDFYILEVVTKNLEEITQCLVDLGVDEDEAITMEEKKFYDFRVTIPRAVNEYISKEGLVKMGTDIQSSLDDFNELIKSYKKLASLGYDHVLFGHIGDCHLHFNFLPKKEQKDECEQELLNFYKSLQSMNITPFAEHGIGIIKQDYMRLFYNDTVKSMFKRLKEEYDKENKFFPQGFLTYYERS